MQCVRHFPAAVAALAWLGCGTGTIDAAPGPKDGAPGEAGGSVLGGGGDQGPGGGAGSAGNAGVDTSAGGTSDTGGGTAAGGAAGATVVPPPPANVSPKDLATKLGLPVQFAWGLGNDGDVIYRPELDAAKLHYKYFTWGWGGWEQPAGQYAKRFLTECTTAGKLPVITFYQAAGWGDSNIWGFQQDAFMKDYWPGYDLMLTTLAAYGKPVLVVMEPDFWGYTMNLVRYNFQDTPSNFNMLVTKYEPDCADLPDNVIGFGKCVVRLAHLKAPNAVLGLIPSRWGGGRSAQEIADYMKLVGGGDADVVFMETLDRDAGCFEDHTLAQCNPSGRATPFYWGAADFADHLAYVKAVTTTLGRPAIWWQTPMGVPSDTPGGTSGHFRDNRVQHFFANVGDLVAAGGFGVMFGPGAGDQATPDSDGGQFQNALAAYAASPALFP